MSARPFARGRDLRGVPVYVSWSGGKDSALALYKALMRGAEPSMLVTMMMETGHRSRSHGLARSTLEQQADALGVPIVFGAASWSAYEPVLERLIRTKRSEDARTGVFGDIDIEENRRWVESLCARTGTTPLFPLWREPRLKLMDILIADGFEAVIVAIKEGALPNGLLGEVLDRAMLRQFTARGIDLAGEHGEYHTVVVNGPIFGHRLALHRRDVILRDVSGFLM